jgi:hypothetical protein
MKATVVLGLVAALTGLGCASVGTGGQATERDFSGYIHRASPSLVVGQARVVDAHVRPALPLGDAQASRVQLDGGRFIVCWTRGSVEEGRRALAQAFKADGLPLGAPVVISPPNVDVVGRPTAIAMDGQHAMATFAAASDSSMQLLAVPIEPKGSRDGGERTAHR